MPVNIRRRELIAALGSAAAWPLVARAQQREQMRRVGVLMGWPESQSEARSEFTAFVQELQKLGWSDGRNLRIDSRWGIPAEPDSMHRFAKGTRRATSRAHFAKHLRRPMVDHA